MAKVNLKKTMKDVKPKVYFSSEYKFQKVAGLELGKTRYFIFLKPLENMYKSMVHKVNKKSEKVTFKGNPYARIKCASFDDEGNKLEEKGNCCELYDSERERLPERDDASKRLIDYPKPIFTLPVLSLSHCLTDSKAKTYGVTKVKLEGSQPAYYEFSKAGWSKILKGLEKCLKEEDKNTGESIIDTELEGEELDEILLKYLDKVIVKVTANETDSSATYDPEFNFIPFNSKAIAKDSGDYKKIVTLWKNPELSELREEIEKFLQLLEQEEPKILMPWTEAELKAYIIDDEETRKNIENYKKSMQAEDEKEAAQVIEEEKEEIVQVIKKDEDEEISPKIEQKGSIELDETDINMEENYAFSFEDEDENYEPEVG